MSTTPEARFCCEASWREARQAAWKARDLNCGCDHNEYCSKCFPPEFRPGGTWDQYKPSAPQPTTGEGQEPSPAVVEALRDLLDAYHAGRLVMDGESSAGYINSLVEAGEAALQLEQGGDRG